MTDDGSEINVVETLPSLSLSTDRKDTSWNDDTAIDQRTIRDTRAAKWFRICQEAQRVPKGWRKKAWIADVAERHNTTVSSLYRRLRKHDKGLAGHQHKKSNKGKAKKWTPEAIDYWVGLVLKKEHRKISKDALYKALIRESKEKGWQIGSYKSALWWLRRRISPQLLAIQRGGARGLDNLLPPVVRDYSDLSPFQILVGDQHKFDFWVTDDESGEVFRPKGYFWVDLRTRCFYGGAIDRKYDSYLMGLALRMGLKVFGPFGGIYTDNGKPEESRYVMGIVKDMRAIGLDANQTVDVHIDDMDDDAEEINPLAGIAGTHRKAIVRNAKAKLIEGRFHDFGAILRDHFHVPGNVKKLGGNQEENEVDQDEIEALAKAGKLLTFREFCLTVLKAMDYYNRVKAHRGVLKEWKWRPKPKSATPMDCLMEYCKHGWKPVRLSDEAIDLVFLCRSSRIIDRGRITLNKEIYEHKTDDRLITLHGQRVEVRYDPLDPEWLLVFKDDLYFCKAELVEYSSMTDSELSKRKIEEKRRRRRGFILEYRTLTSGVQDIREYSQVPEIEKAAAIIGQEKRKQLAERAELNKEMTDEEIEKAVSTLEEREKNKRETIFQQAQGAPRTKKLPTRPGYFLSALDRHRWVVRYELAGGELSEEDSKFKIEHESQMSEEQREYLSAMREVGGL